MIVWILLGLVLGLILSKIVSTTGEGTVVDILLGTVGAVLGGWLFNLFGGMGVTGFSIDSVYSVGIAAIGAIILLALYHSSSAAACYEFRRADSASLFMER
jgi:uncharacterized membrane protein YeaQ/YmgE (transglycosylase-associated protein family)